MFFFLFSNISHLATFFLFTCTSGVRTKGWWVGLEVGRGGPYWPGGGGAKRRGFNLWPLQFCNVLRPCVESDTPYQSSTTLRRKWSIFQSLHFSLDRRETRPVNTVSTQVLVCVFPHWIRLHKNHKTKEKGCLTEKKKKKMTARDCS